MMKEREDRSKEGSASKAEQDPENTDHSSTLSYRVRTPLNTISLLATHLMAKAPSQEIESLKAIQVAVGEILEALETLSAKRSSAEQQLRSEIKPLPLAPSVPEGAIKGKRILVVEDHKTNQVLLTRLLEEAGATVKAVENGEDAIEEIRVGGSFNIILMDIHLPGISGYETTRRLKKSSASSAVPILAMTALSLPSDKDKCFEAGMDGFIAKPIKKDELLSAIVSLAR